MEGFTEFCSPINLLTGFQEVPREEQGELGFGMWGLHF